MAQSDWKNEIYAKLIAVLENDVESLTRVLFYLDREDEAYVETGITSQVWHTLKLSLNNENLFKSYSQRLAEDTKCGEIDIEFYKTMSKVYAQIMEPSEESTADIADDDWCLTQNMRLSDTKVSTNSSFISLERVWDLITTSTQTNILDLILRVISNRQIASFSSFASITGGKLAMINLAAIFVGYESIVSLIRWWNREISGKRCAKNILDSWFTMAAEIGGYIGGAVMGTVFAGPIGGVVGCVSGGIISCVAMNILIDKLTQTIFGIPRDEVLENAYKYFNVDMSYA